MLTVRLTAGVGVGFSGACGLPLVWRVRKPLPCTLRLSAKLTQSPLSAATTRRAPPC